MNDDVVKAENLVKWYPVPKRYREIFFQPFSSRKILAVDGISINIKQKEIFGLLGPNGAGKTTLIKMLIGLVFPTSGYAEICGINIVENLNQAKHKLGCVLSEERSFFWRLTGRQNLEFFATLYNLDKKDAKKRIDYLFELVELQDKADEQFMNYSTGMKQKMAITRGLLINPDVLFMDEPTKSLDPYTASKLRNFVKEEIVGKMGKTVFMATHNLLDVEDLCTKIAIINKGKIKAVGTPREIRKIIDSKKRFNITTLNMNNDIGNRLKSYSDIELESINNIEDSGFLITIKIEEEKEILPDIIKFLVENNIKIISIKEIERSLTEVFSKIVEDN
jgi:ABC-2 type transport system ATP-binding protein